MTKKIFTVSQMIEKIQDEMDLQEETFITQDEYIAYINEAIDDVEAEIHSLYEGYFNTSTTLDLVSGTKRYSIGTKNEVQTVTFDATPDSGTFTLTFGGQTTSALSFDSSASDVSTAFNALSSVGTGNTSWSGSVTSSEGLTVTFQNDLAATDQATISSASSLLIGATPVVISHATTRDGGALNIYANKIRLVQYKRDNTTLYRVPRIKLNEIASVEATTTLTSDNLMYDIQYDSTAKGAEIVFYPTPDRTESGVITLWYLRNAERVSGLDDLIDCPDAHPYIFAFLKRKVALKEFSPLLPAYENELLDMRQKLRETFSEMIPDENEELRRDLSFYTDFDDYYFEVW